MHARPFIKDADNGKNIKRYQAYLKRHTRCEGKQFPERNTCIATQFVGTLPLLLFIQAGTWDFFVLNYILTDVPSSLYVVKFMWCGTKDFCYLIGTAKRVFVRLDQSASPITVAQRSPWSGGQCFKGWGSFLRVSRVLCHVKGPFFAKNPNQECYIKTCMEFSEENLHKMAPNILVWHVWHFSYTGMCSFPVCMHFYCVWSDILERAETKLPRLIAVLIVLVFVWEVVSLFECFNNFRRK